MEATATPKAPLSVPFWIDWLSGTQARHPSLWIGLGNLESALLRERIADLAITRPLYIAGLARSGSTILLELLARHPQLASHRYRDFPPMFTPWSWNWFVDHAGAREDMPAERAHGDGITVTQESPEAFEEVLWMAFFPHLHDPTQSAALNAQTSNPGFEHFYQDHIRKLLLLRGGSRYLSKANYNVTRLPYLLKLFPDAKFIVPVRDPAWHVASLMRQHERFCGEHARDVRLMRHMSRAGHYEFGLERRPINTGNAELLEAVMDHWAKGEEVQGWSLYWQAVYGHLAHQLESDPTLRRATQIVDFDALCRDPARSVQALATHCELPQEELDLGALAGTMIRQPSYYQPTFSTEDRAFIAKSADPVYQRLLALV
jgi:hypothetical protein